MPPQTNLVLLGDSTIDNYHWVNDGETLEDKLKDQFGEDHVHSLAVDGFTTRDVLQGGNRGKAVCDKKHINGDFYYPLSKLNEIKDPSHILVSVGGNNVREYLQSLIRTAPQERDASLKRILETLTQEYQQIIERIKAQKPNAKPIIMLQYTPLLANDLYDIYFLMDLLRHKQKANLWTAIQYGFYKLFGFIHLSSRIQALKKLHDIMATVYKPILDYAKENKIPVIDLASTLDYNDTSFYCAQIEPSVKGGKAIADLVKHVIFQHGFHREAKLYSRPGCDQGDILADKIHEDWQPHHVPETTSEADALFLSFYQRALDRDHNRFFGCFTKSRLESRTFKETVEHAQGKSKSGTGERSCHVMQQLGWLNEDKSINEHSGLKTLLSM